MSRRVRSFFACDRGMSPTILRALALCSAIALGAVRTATHASTAPGDVPPERHQLLVFFADGHEPLTTLDVPVTEEAGEVGTTNLYVPGDFALTERLEALGWTAIRRSSEHRDTGGYVVSFACTCERGVWWVPGAAARLSASAGIDSIRWLAGASGAPLDFEPAPVPIATYRPVVPPDSLAGAVHVRARVDSCGRVVDATIERSELPEAYETAAIDAARRWRFRAWSCDAALDRARRARDRIDADVVVIPFRFER